MSYVVAGAFSGLLMAAVSVAVGPIMLFMLAKDPPNVYRVAVGRIPPMALTMALVVISYPAWLLLGVIAGLLYWGSTTQLSGGGAGSPNLAYTAAVVAMTVLAAFPLGALFRRSSLWVLGYAVLFAGNFGWVLPWFAE